MIANKRELYEYIDQDCQMNQIKRGWKYRFRNLLYRNSIPNFLYLMRKTEYYQNQTSFFSRLFSSFYKYRYRVVSRQLGFSIGLNTCGPGLSIPHYGTIIINSKAKIGANCRIHACVNIGASAGSPLAPQIGDNVYIGPSVVIFGDIKIANNVVIGANATVNKSCEIENVVLAGSPAKVVKENVKTWIEFNGVKPC